MGRVLTTNLRLVRKASGSVARAAEDISPAALYLASLAEAGRRPMRVCLERAARRGPETLTEFDACGEFDVEKTFIP